MIIKPSYEEVVNRIRECVSAFTFMYKGVNCGFDPYYEKRNNTIYCDVWCGDTTQTAKGIDNALNLPLFNNKTLREIFNKIEIVEY